MTTIPSAAVLAVYTVHIQRFDPSVDKNPYLRSYEVPVTADEFGPMTALKALHYINQYIEPVAYDYNCRRGTCGRCAMLIDGKPRLACYFELSQEHVLEPLPGCPILRDLVVDKTVQLEKFAQVSSIAPRIASEKTVPISGEFWRDTVYPINACRACMCCTVICPVMNRSASAKKFLGPGPLQKLFLKYVVKNDVKQALKQAEAGGLMLCTLCGKCSLVCPSRIDCAENIKTLQQALRESKQ